MRRNFILMVVGLYFASAGVTHAVGTISTLDVRVTVFENATIEVAEAIVYDFGAEERHGIFRTIPYSYQAGSETYTADISSVIVTDEFGRARPFTESRGNGMLTIKIGDPNETVTGAHAYIITYVVEGPFLYFDDYDELYWNVAGSWEDGVGIGRASALVDLPRGVSVLRAACYQGKSGSDATCDSEERLVNSERAGYTAVANNLESGEGFTIAVAFPKGIIVEQKKPWEGRQQYSPVSYVPLGIPVLVFVVVLYLWYTRGKDPKGRGTIVTQFEPPKNVPPSVAGVVYNERIESREFSAEIVRLAVEGYIKIHRIEEKVLVLLSNTDYLIEKLDPGRSPSDPVAELLLHELFQSAFEETKTIDGREVTGTLLSKMKHEFVEEKKAIEKRIYDETVLQGFFLTRPDKVRGMYFAVGIAFVIVGIAIATQSTEAFMASFAIGTALSGVVVAIAGVWMPVKTGEGVYMKEYLEGFKNYLEVAEKDRLEFHNAPERTPELFDAYLPYAMAFGVEEAWSKQFEDIYTEQPNWYSGSAGQTFAAGAFASELASFTSDFATASAPQSSGSGGGGSSGGGFGGGGGGSW